ncbi:Chromosome partition protein Smc [uncultured Blautia sp.]|nr:Chromosome partition protein Smc [uncultured Blautia sp.]
MSVTRRYYRSGESEYYINRQSVRLKDLTELFLDTGMGREGYSIIGPGDLRGGRRHFQIPPPEGGGGAEAGADGGESGPHQ